VPDFIFSHCLLFPCFLYYHSLLLLGILIHRTCYKKFSFFPHRPRCLNQAHHNNHPSSTPTSADKTHSIIKHYHHCEPPSSCQSSHPEQDPPTHWYDGAHQNKESFHQLKPPPLCHPCSLNTLPSQADKWSAMIHPIWATVMGFHSMIISYMHHCFYNSQVLLTNAFAISTTATTVGDFSHCFLF
jgi:hypothetical protein